MKNLETVLKEIHKTKGVPPEEMYMTLEVALIAACRKNYGLTGELRIEFDEDSGNFYVKKFKTVVADLEDDDIEIGLTDAEKLSSEVELGDQIEVDVTPLQFLRVAAQTVRQVVMQKIGEVDRKNVYDKFSEKLHTMVVGKIQRFDRGDALIELDEGIEAILPYREQIPGQRFRPGEHVKSVVIEVKKASKGPQVVLSRTHPGFLQKLFEQEIPEIPDKLVEIKGIAREPGIRSKISVYSAEDHIDPVGSCVGLRGSRIQVVVNELHGEKIDIVPWSDDIKTYLSNALAPAKPKQMEYFPDENRMFVIVPDSQLSLAIGREGQNVRLAAKLADIKIDIVKESDYIRGLNQP